MSRIIFYLMAILIAFTSLSCACAGDNMENCISGPIYNDSPMENCSFETNLDNVDTQDVASNESDINEENLSKETHFFSTIYDFGDNYDNNLTIIIDFENKTDVTSNESDINEENLSKETHFFSTIYDFGDNYDNNLTNLEV